MSDYRKFNNPIILKVMKARKIMLSMAAAAMAHTMAVADMKAEYGESYIPDDGTELNYTWDPFDGMLA